MKILVLLSYDAANLALENIVKELYQRKHKLYLYAYSMENHNIRMFNSLTKNIKPLNALTDELIDKVDIILAANDMVWRVIDKKKYIFTYNMASGFGTALSEGGDIMFMPSYIYYRHGHEKTVSIVAGNSKTREEHTLSKDNVRKQILFIDSGHYPFGKKGREKLTQLLLQICSTFPDYKLVVKPRFLKSDTEITHNNKNHLYDCLKEACNGHLPGNLILLGEHRDMVELIDEASVVLCLYTSAFYEVVEMGKPAIIIQGLPNEDSLDLNNECFWNPTEQLLAQSGCLVNYNDVLKYLPEGKTCNKSFLQKNCPTFDSKKSYETIVDCMEFCFQQFISKGYFICMAETNAISYHTDLRIEEDGSWDKLINRRIHNEVKYVASRYFDAIGIDIDLERLDELKDWVYRNLERLSAKGDIEYPTFHDVLIVKLNNIYIKYFENKRGNSIQESYFLKALYESEKWKFRQIQEENVECRRTYYYFKGLDNFECRKFKEARKYLVDYLYETDRIEYEEYVTDRKEYQEKAKEIINAIFPFDRIEHNKRIIIYGYGVYGKEFLEQLREEGSCQVIAIADQNYNYIYEGDIPIISPEEIMKQKFDYVCISIRNTYIQSQVSNRLLEEGVPRKKIIL